MTTLPLTRSGSLRARVRAMLPELVSFGGVGLVAFVVDLLVFNLARTLLGADQVIAAKAIAAVVSMSVAWLGNRHLTYRARRGAVPQSRSALTREAALFVVSNLIGLGIAAACLLVSHDLLGLTSVLADNLSANVVGLVLATAFRFFAYRRWVFVRARG